MLVPSIDNIRGPFERVATPHEAVDRSFVSMKRRHRPCIRAVERFLKEGETPSAATRALFRYPELRLIYAPNGAAPSSARAFARAAGARRRRGGAARDFGAIVAIEDMAERLAEDHARAQRLAVALAERFPGSVDPEVVRTNIVCARADRLPADVPRGARVARRSAPGTIDPDTVRLVTHKDIDDADIDRTIAAFDALVLEAVEAAEPRHLGRPPDRADGRRVASTSDERDGGAMRVLITGCSSGFGRGAAVELTKRGHEVIATARRPEVLEDLDVAQRLALDVDSDASVAETRSRPRAGSTRW